MNEDTRQENFKYPEQIKHKHPELEELSRLVFGSGGITAVKAFSARLKRLVQENKIDSDGARYILHELSELGEQIKVETVGEISIPLQDTKLKHAEL